RRGLGRLAEVFGPAFIEQDTTSRLFLYRGDMEREWAAYGADARQIAERFVAGVNAYIDWLGQHPELLPWEVKRLNYSPAKWGGEGIVAIPGHWVSPDFAKEEDRTKGMIA